MMLSTLKQWFQTYTVQFYTDDSEFNRNIFLKADHCIRTSKIAGDISARENFSSNDWNLSRIIGLLHDIGRFEQYKQFKTFADHQSIDHGELGEKILHDSGCLNELSERDQRCIFKSIRYHNQLSLPAQDDLEVIKFTRLIRDADKIDIFRISCGYFTQRTAHNKNSVLELGTDDRPEISDRIFEQFMSDPPALMKDVETLDDFKALMMSWVFDLNYKRAFELMDQRKYLERLYHTMPAEYQRARDVYHQARLFLDQRLNAVMA